VSEREQMTQTQARQRTGYDAELARLQALIDRSIQTATPSVAESVAYRERQMSAAEFVEFWRSVRLVAMTTVGAAGQPHTAPVHAQLGGARFRMGPAHEADGDANSNLTTLRVVIYENAVRRADLALNPRVAFATWRDDGSAAILYGRATEVPESIREARAGRSGKPRRVVRPPERRAE
jgi:Pyridoxamine 5'-phosphate oxidase